MQQRSTGGVTIFEDDGKLVKAHKDKLCRGSTGSGPSLMTSDVTLIWEDGKWVKAHKDKLCRGSADSERELIVQSLKHVQPSKPSC